MALCFKDKVVNTKGIYMKIYIGDIYQGKMGHGL